jgi:hypothetical protein
MVHTTLRTRNYVVAGDYLVYGWITDDRKHMLRIMKLNQDYTKLDRDVVAEIDCPSGNDGRLMVGSIARRGWLTFTIPFQGALRLAAIWEASQVTAYKYATNGRVRHFR